MVKQEEPIKIEIEDLEETPAKAEKTEVDVAEELRNLGRQFAETVQTAWNSAERHRLEEEFKEGVNNFVDELGKVVTEMKSSPAAQKVRTEASKVDTERTKGAIAQGLRWISNELERLSKRMSPSEEEAAFEDPPAEKTPPAE